MQTTEEIKRQLSATGDMRSVVRTMKSLAAVNIRQYEKAARSLADYERVIEMGLSVVLRNRPEQMEFTRETESEKYGAIVFGSDQGMCGQFNENIVDYTEEVFRELDIEKSEITILALGEKVAGLLKSDGFNIGDKLSVPASTAGITESTRAVLYKIVDWRETRDVRNVYLLFNEPKSRASYDPSHIRLLPTDSQWLESLITREWDSRSLPIFTMNWDELFSALIREYLFVSIFRATADSLNSENASRLSAMQVAEKNIDERLDMLKTQYNRQRQSSITSELLDIVAGFEALTKA